MSTFGEGVTGLKAGDG